MFVLKQILLFTYSCSSWESLHDSSPFLFSSYVHFLFTSNGLENGQCCACNSCLLTNAGRICGFVCTYFPSGVCAMQLILSFSIHWLEAHSCGVAVTPRVHIKVVFLKRFYTWWCSSGIRSRIIIGVFGWLWAMVYTWIGVKVRLADEQGLTFIVFLSCVLWNHVQFISNTLNLSKALKLPWSPFAKSNTYVHVCVRACHAYTPTHVITQSRAEIPARSPFERTWTLTSWVQPAGQGTTSPSWCRSALLAQSGAPKVRAYKKTGTAGS